MSDEHVIPDSLGGYYHIKSVCKQCNSELGKNVDSPLVNHNLSDLYRFAKKMKGKSGKIPNPFRSIFTQGETSKKARIEIGKNLELVPRLIPEIEYYEKNGVIDSIKIELDSKDESKIDEIIGKISKRIGVPVSSIIKNNFHREADPEAFFKGTLEIDTRQFKIGLLKIAYEFAVDSITEYLDDPDAETISCILHDANHDRTGEYVNFGSGFDKNILNPYHNFLDFKSAKHYIILTNMAGGLFCIINLHGTFSIGVTLSKKKYFDEIGMIIGINDINKKTFRKISANDLINETHGRLACDFTFHCENKAQLSYYAKIQRDPKFSYEHTDPGLIPLYHRNGAEIGLNLANKLLTSKGNCNIGDNKIVDYFLFDENDEIFIKAIPSGTLMRIRSFKMTRKLIKKL